VIPRTTIKTTFETLVIGLAKLAYLKEFVPSPYKVKILNVVKKVNSRQCKAFPAIAKSSVDARNMLT
jgi:hypothetical protein